VSDTPEKVKVENHSGVPVWVPGGEVEPGKPATRPRSEQLDELMKAKVLTEYVEPDPDEKSSAKEKK
jgi:hypothetical protein